MSGDLLLQLLLGGLSIGSVYAIVALGFNYIYAVRGVVNFAQGEFVMVGGLSAWYLHDRFELPLGTAVIGALIISGLLGYLIEVLVVRPFTSGELIGQVLLTLGAAIAIGGAGGIVFGVQPRYLPGLRGNVELFGASIAKQSILVMSVLGFIAVGSTYIIRRSFVGTLFRACSDDPFAARLMGIRLNRVFAAAFVISGALGGLAGIVVAPTTGLSYTMGIPLAVKGFTAAIIGGLGNPTGGFIGGLLIGVLEVFVSGLLSSTYKDVLSVVALFLVLLLRPQGIFRDVKREAESL